MIEAATGKIHNNPLEFAERKMVVKIEHEELKFNFGKGCSGWQGPLDSAPMRKAEDYGRPSTTALWPSLLGFMGNALVSVGVRPRPWSEVPTPLFWLCL